MSRSGYNEDCDDDLELGRWRGMVASAIRGKRGQAFLREMFAALSAMPVKRLVADELEANGEVCAIGAVGKVRGIDMSTLDPEDADRVGSAFGINHAMAREIVYMNDEGFGQGRWEPSPEERFEKMRAWVLSQIKGIRPRRHGWTRRYYASRNEREALK